MTRRPWIRRTAAALGILVGIVVFAGVAYDRATASTLLPGMRIDGVAVGGMTREDATAALAEVAAEAEATRLTIRAGDAVWTTSPRGIGARVDVAGTVDAAFAELEGLGFVERVVRRIEGDPFDVEVPLRPAVETSTLGAWIRDAAASVDADPVDAVFELVDGEVVLRPAVVGRSLDRADAIVALGDAIASGAATVELPVTVREPASDGAGLGKTIVVDISENRLVLYDGTAVELEYRVATGAPGYPTPLGSFEIIRKAENPTWVNPDPEGWGKDYPPSIGPGPGNPLGTRALYLDAPGIRIHGTYNASSIGTFASHGCVRMLISDSEALYPLVPIGTRVFIVA
ncbi:MAG: L,D-transpeptidase family protein [Actinomycetota bacterium]